MTARPVRIGCSGWQYATGATARSIPRDCRERRWLSHYASRFDTVELNSTFYRLARPGAAARWVAADAPGDSSSQ